MKGTATNGPGQGGAGAKSPSGPTANVSRCHGLGRAEGRALWIILEDIALRMRYWTAPQPPVAVEVELFSVA